MYFYFYDIISLQSRGVFGATNLMINFRVEKNYEIN